MTSWNSMMTSSNGNMFRVTGPLCGEFTGPGEYPSQRPVTRSFDVYFDLRLNKRLSKQSWGWWFETPLWSIWRQCNGNAFRITVPLSPVDSLYKGPVMRSFDVSHNKMLNKHFIDLWSWTPWRSCDVTVMHGQIIAGSYHHTLLYCNFVSVPVCWFNKAPLSVLVPIITWHFEFQFMNIDIPSECWIVMIFNQPNYHKKASRLRLWKRRVQ